MNLDKLKLRKLKKVQAIHFPSDIDLGAQNADEPEVIIYFISELQDGEAFVQTCMAAKLPADNRTIMVYRKGNKSLNRDTIISPFRQGEYREFRLRAPLLCSLSDELSAFVMQKI